MGNLNKRVLKNRLAWIKKWLQELEGLPLDNKDVFMANKRFVQMADLALRRSAEALVELGAYILKEAFDTPVTKFQEIPKALVLRKVMLEPEAQLLEKVIQYCEQIEQGVLPSPEEVYQTCKDKLVYFSNLYLAYEQWANSFLAEE